MAHLSPRRRPQLAAFALLASVACATAPQESFPVLQSGAHGGRAPLPGSVADHVVIVSIDGLRPDAVQAFGASTLQRLMREGSFSLAARTVLPSKTLPSHTSMLTGVEPAVHGITWNSDETRTRGFVAVPTIFSVARARGLQTAAFFSKTKFRHLSEPGTVDHAWGPRRDGLGPAPADRLLSELRTHLLGSRPDLMFVHFAQPDHAGHLFGWMGSSYGRAVRQADQSVAELIEILDSRLGRGGYTLIVTSDHGGHGRAHGGDDDRHTAIPWIVWGAGVRAGAQLPMIRTTDTGATALWLLGIDVPSAWSGRPVARAFEARASLAGVSAAP
jgi:predicted AlkP superfamily pyrophosphatase or phosphodiesterase